MELKNEDGDTPLMLAVRSNQLGVVDMLCKRGCNLHTQGFDHMEPIDYAINKHNLFISDVLMKHERQHLNSASSSINESSNNNNNNHNHNHNQADDLTNKNTKQNSTSLTSLIHEEQQKHTKKQQHSNHDDSTLFEND
jgi:ankyrin repeat protein